MAMSPHRMCSAPPRGRWSAFRSTSQSGTTAVRTAMWAQEFRRRTKLRDTTRSTGATIANVWSYERPFAGIDRLQRFRLEDEAVGWSIEASNGQKLCNAAPAVDACNVNDHVDGQCDRFADASMRQTDIRGQHAMREPRQGLVGGVRVDRAEASEVAGVEGLQEVEGLGAADLADDDPSGQVHKGCAEQVSDADRRQRRLVPQRHLSSPRLQSEQIGFVEMDLCGLLYHHDPIAIRDPSRQGVQQRRLSRSGAAGNEDVPLRGDGGDEPASKRWR